MVQSEQLTTIKNADIKQYWVMNVLDPMKCSSSYKITVRLFTNSGMRIGAPATIQAPNSEWFNSIGRINTDDLILYHYNYPGNIGVTDKEIKDA
ncbi:MAG: hypothetical protein ACLRQF_03035 [Thomasclavelia ramosa]